MTKAEGNTIQLLSERLTNKIAAGEVVERPASIVKELVENAIDADAKNITVSIRGGGKQYIRVMDDGIGMSYDDTLLSFERHATSKIKTDDDLNGILTLGFRGEALPSIASVSKVTLTTAKTEIGTQINIAGGVVNQVKDAAHPRGTTVEIKNLFFNTPARRKFLKTDTTELHHITRIITQQSLSRPNIYFKLQVNDRNVIESPAANDELKYKIASLFGNELINDLLPVEADAEDVKVFGFVSKSAVTRSNRESQYVFVNNRFVRDKTINHAISSAYSHTIEKNRYPVVFLFVTLKPDLVDVNVHPSKTEVRFFNQNTVHDLVSDAVSTALYRRQPLQVQDEKLLTPVVKDNSVINTKEHLMTKVKEATEKYVASVQYPSTDPKPSYTPDKFINKKQEDKQEQLTLPNISPSAVSPFTSGSFNILGQLKNSFIIMENNSGMLVIDQHTAHERILYETISKKLKDSKLEVQMLLIPLNIELSKPDSIILQENITYFEKSGFAIEHFGANHFIIRAVPSIIKGQDCLAIVRDIIDTFSQYGKDTSFEQILEKIAASMACHAAIKANRRLEIKEMEALIKQLEEYNIPYTCPHGRPIALLFGINDIEKRFGR